MVILGYKCTCVWCALIVFFVQAEISIRIVTSTKARGHFETAAMITNRPSGLTSATIESARIKNPVSTLWNFDCRTDLSHCGCFVL